MYYNAYILPVIDYCLTIWGNCPKSQLERINKIQKRIAHLILDAPFDTPSKTLFHELKWLQINDRINFQKAVLVYKCINWKMPEYMREIFDEIQGPYALWSTIHGHVKLPKPKTEQFRYSLKYSGAKIWNSLPTSVRSATSVESFKEKYLKYLKLDFN